MHFQELLVTRCDLETVKQEANNIVIQLGESSHDINLLLNEFYFTSIFEI